MSKNEEIMEEIDKINDLIVDDKIEELKKIFATKRINLNVFDSDDFTPLRIALLRDNLELVNLILDQPGIDVNLKREHQENHIHSFIHFGENYEIIASLIKKGCDPNVRSKCGYTPLYKAVENDYHSNLAKILIENGADINFTNDKYEDCTPLHKAVTGYSLDGIDVLLYYGADANKFLKGLYTPFAWGLRHECYENSYKLLLYESEFNDATFSLAIHKLWRDDKSFFNEFMDLALVYSKPLCFRDAIAIDLVFKTRNSFLLSEICQYNSELLLSPYEGKPFFQKYLFCNLPYNIWLYCLYQILSLDIASEMIANWINCFDKLSDSCCYFESLANAFELKFTTREDRLALIYILLSFGVPVCEWDVFTIYSYYGNDSELDAIMSVPVYPCPLVMRDWRTSLIPNFFINFGIDIEQDLIKFLRKDYFDDEDMSLFLHALKFVTASNKVRELYVKRVDEICGKTNGDEEYLNVVKYLDIKIRTKFTETNHVPTLTELSRNSSRLFIFNKVPVKDSYNYLLFLNRLPIPEVIKDLIRFKRPITNLF